LVLPIVSIERVANVLLARQDRFVEPLQLLLALPGGGLRDGILMSLLELEDSSDLGGSRVEARHQRRRFL